MMLILGPNISGQFNSHGPSWCVVLCKSGVILKGVAQAKVAMVVPLFIGKNSNHLDHPLEEMEAEAAISIYFRPLN